MKKISKLILGTVMAVFSLFVCSCVHEWPELSGTTNVKITIKHVVPWTQYDHVLDTRSGDGQYAQYDLRVYRAGNTDVVVKNIVFTSDDLTHGDFTTSIDLPEGEWDIYVWQDLRSDADDPFYNLDDFNSIRVVKPHRGYNDMREAFEGKVTVSVPPTINADASIEAEMVMERPMSKYIFIATDLNKFIAETLTKAGYIEDTRAWKDLSAAQRSEILDGYKIVVLYPYFMPSVYNMFTTKVIDSDRGTSFEGKIQPINDNEAVVAFDHVFINHRESGVQVQLGMKTPDGKTLQLTKINTIPIMRNRETYVRGEFLTTQSGSGINIDVSFSGEYNIEI